MEPGHVADALIARMRSEPSTFVMGGRLAPERADEIASIATRLRGRQGDLARLKAVYAALVDLIEGRPEIVHVERVRALEQAFDSHVLARDLVAAQGYLERWLAAEGSPEGRKAALASAAVTFDTSGFTSEAAALRARAEAGD